MALDREQILKAAVDLMDEVGLEGLSLRRLATRLGVAAPALYWHFTNKQELLDQMAEQLFLAEMPPARTLRPGETWEEWLVQRARDSRAGLARHRDGAMLAAATKPRGAQWDQIELQIRVLCEAGFSPSEAAHAMFTVSNYVAGFAIEEQADRRRAETPGPEMSPRDIMAWVLRQGPYPLLAEALGEMGDPQSDAVFEHGLQLIVAGMRARLAAPR